ncbi:MAG: prepilin-type N-terminal cleavage/methylation domain-containing protein [Actinomycetota bacterium]
MSRLRDRLRGIHDERGMTLVEMMVTTSLIGIVSIMFLSVMASVQAGIGRQMDRSHDNDQARLAVQQLDKEIRSGNVLYDPNDPAFLPAGTDPGMGLTIYTQTFANIRNPGNRCVQWRILDEELQRRDWSTGDPNGSVSPWRVIAENVVNVTLEGGPVTAFQLDTDPSKGSRIVDVEIVTLTDSDSGNPIRIEASISGRNTSYGYPLSVCSTIPAA